jgi:PAS domain S-box-containing protein
MAESPQNFRVFNTGLLLSIGLIALLLLFNVGLGALNTRLIAENDALVTHTNETLDAMDAILATMVDAETGERGYLITGEDQYLQPYKTALAAIHENFDRLKRLTSDHPVQQSRLPELKKSIDEKLDELERTIDLRRQDPEASRQAVLTHLGKNLMDGIRKQIATMEQDERALWKIREQRSRSSYFFAIGTDIVAAVFSLAMLGTGVYVLHGYLLTRAKAAAAIYEQQEWFRTTIGSIGDGVIATDVAGRVKILNRVAESLTGWNEAEAAGKPMEEVFSILNEKTRQKAENPVAKVLQTGKIVGLANHTALIARDGTERSIADSAAPIRDKNGRVTGVVLVFRDVSEQKRMEDALARLASFPTLNPSPVMEADFSGIIHYLNPASKVLFPDLPQQGLRHPWMAGWENFTRPLREDGTPKVEREISIGEHFYHQTASYVRGTGHIRIYGMDITLRRRAEEVQTQERANLQAIFDAVNVGMLLIDENGAVRRVNNAVSRWLGKDIDGLIGTQPGELVGCIHALAEPTGCGHTPYCSSCPIRNTFESVFRTGEFLHDIETEARISNNGHSMGLWLEASADPLVLDGRRHVVMALNNITVRKQVEASLKRTAEELARSNRDLEQFAYVASHDLQEPLRMVAGYLQLLADRYRGKIDEKADKYIAYAVEGAERMSGLIRDLLAYSRVNSHGGELQEVKFQDALDFARRNLEISIRESGATITHDELPAVRADQVQLAQVLQNLLGNAIKFRSPDRPLEIHISAQKESDHWLFSVRDNGIGFEQQYEDKIFLIFQRLHGREHYAGTGIGLAICKRIIEQHGGKIWATGKPNEGTTFTFTLPT